MPPYDHMDDIDLNEEACRRADEAPTEDRDEPDDDEQYMDADDDPGYSVL